MEPCVVVASSCSAIKVDEIVKGILETEDLPEPLCLVEGIRSYPWHIKTKYYEADVHVCAMDQKTIGNQAFADSVNGVILCFDGASKVGLSVAEQWLTFTKELEADVKILLCEKCSPDSFQGISSDGISRVEAQTWCVSNGFELVELNPDLDFDSDVEDDFPECVGMKRVIQALGAHLWPNMILKESTARVAPFRAFSNGVGADELSHPIAANNSNIVPPYMDNRLSDSFPDNRSLEHLPEHPIGSRTSKLVAAVRPIQQSPEREGISNIAIVSPTLHHSQEETMPTEAIIVDDEQMVDATMIPGNTGGVPMASISPFSPIVSTDFSEPVANPTPPTSHSDTNAPPPTRDERIDAVLEAMDSMSEETFEGLFQNLNEMKLKAQSLSPDQRRVYAEKMAVAFWKSIGGNDSEIEGLSSDED